MPGEGGVDGEDSITVPGGLGASISFIVMIVLVVASILAPH